MSEIRPTEVLWYHDGIEVFAAENPVGGSYLGVFAEERPEADRYLVVGAHPDNIKRFKDGQSDLRDLILSTPLDNWYMVDADVEFGDPLELVPQTVPLAHSPYIPEAGFVLEPAVDDQLALDYARERGNTVFAFAIDSPIRIDDLSLLLSHMHTMVEQAYRFALRKLPLAEKKRIDPSDAAAMRVVVPAAPGSYRMVLESEAPPDAEGSSELVKGLEIIDDLFANVDSARETLRILGGRRSRLANTYGKFIKFLDDHGTGMTYDWAVPRSPKMQRGKVTREAAESLSEQLFPLSDPVIRSKEFTGTLAKANLRTGTWGMWTDQVGYLTGRSKGRNHTLRRSINGEQYRIICEVVQHSGLGGRPKNVYYLTEMESMQRHLDMNMLERPPRDD